LLLIKHNYYCH